jgi:hypothetical protein
MSFDLWTTLGISREAGLAIAVAGLVLAAAMALFLTRRREEQGGIKLNERE